jgi:hypothetical protein
VKHFASTAFWRAYEALPPHIRNLADKNYAILKENQRHPSLNFKRVGRFWSVRIGTGYRALGVIAKSNRFPVAAPGNSTTRE